MALFSATVLGCAVLVISSTAVAISGGSQKTKASTRKAKASPRTPVAPPSAAVHVPEALSFPADPVIVAALHDISPGRLRATDEKLVSFHNRSTLSAADEQAVATGKGIGAARAWIKAEFERYSQACQGCLEVNTDSFVEPPAERIKVPTQIVNVYAIQRGTHPESARRVYLVTGHYDSRNSDNFNVEDAAPGANDDASGTAVSLECARVLSQHKFPATIIYLTVAGEEQGLNGSRHFAKMAKAQGWNIEGVLNNDIVGGNRTPGETLQDNSTVRVFSESTPDAATEAELKAIRAVGGENDSASRQLARYIREVSRTYLPARTSAFAPKLIFRRDRFLRGGDHTAFNEQGFAAVRFTEYREDYNHQHQNVRVDPATGIEYGDLVKFVDFDYVANVARLNAATLASLASAPAPPRNVKLATTKLENDSTLQWEPSADGRATGYEVVWRPTSAAEWENVEPAGAATQSTLQRSKDNVFFAVRAVDKQGHRSLPVVPSPERLARAARSAAAPPAPPKD